MSYTFEQRVQETVSQVVPQFRFNLDRDVAALGAMGVNSVDALKAVILDHSIKDYLRETACWLLGRLGDNNAVYPLLHIVRNEDDSLQRAAIRSLGQLGNRRAVQPLLLLLQQSRDPELRTALVYTLGMLADERTIDPLINILGDPDEDTTVRGFAAEALVDSARGTGNERVVQALHACLSDPSATVRYWSAFALGELRASEAMPELEQLVATDQGEVEGWGRVQEEAMRAIEKIRVPD